MHWIETTFGTSDLYDLLSCPRDANRGALRRAYYRAALQHHPDKNGGGDSKRFQAISLAYQILENPETRSEYDETGVIPGDDALDSGGDDLGSSKNKAGVDQWKQYFDRIFGRVTTSKIDAFAQKYKCSDEECRDVLAAFVKCKGNLSKMVDIVLVSEYRDAERWVSDYLRPAFEAGTLDRKYEAAMDKSLSVCQKKAAKQDKEESEGEDNDGVDDDSEVARGMVDDEETESDNALDEKEQKKQPQHKKGRVAQSAASKTSPKKGGKTKSKPKMDDLVAAIQSKRGGGSSSRMFASLGARYGVNMEDDDDPLGGEKFEKAQSMMLRKGKGGSTTASRSSKK
jgi:DnaJ family protein C protein 9